MPLEEIGWSGNREGQGEVLCEGAERARQMAGRSWRYWRMFEIWEPRRWSDFRASGEAGGMVPFAVST